MRVVGRVHSFVAAGTHLGDSVSAVNGVDRSHMSFFRVQWADGLIQVARSELQIQGCGLDVVILVQVGPDEFLIKTGLRVISFQMCSLNLPQLFFLSAAETCRLPILNLLALFFGQMTMNLK